MGEDWGRRTCFWPPKNSKYILFFFAKRFLRGILFEANLPQDLPRPSPMAMDGALEFLDC